MTKVSKIPNITHPQTPIDKEKIIKFFGEKRKFNFKFYDHLYLAKYLDILDFESASIVSGIFF
jgi:seryl-tRNA synthetase